MTRFRFVVLAGLMLAAAPIARPRAPGEAVADLGAVPQTRETPGAQAAPRREWRCSTCGAIQKRPPQLEPRNEWRCTTKPGKLFIHVFAWRADGNFELPAVKAKIVKATLLATGKPMDFQQTDAGVTLDLPVKAPDAIASVVRLETK